MAGAVVPLFERPASPARRVQPLFLKNIFFIHGRIYMLHLKRYEKAHATIPNMKISLFGNPDLPDDNMPHRIKSRLETRFPDMRFVAEDPNELDLPVTDTDWVIIDCVRGIPRVMWLTMGDIAEPTTRVTAHVFDLAAFLLFAKKLNKNIGIRILGIPMPYDEEKALQETTDLLKKIL
jgi:hypothetical protein